MKRVWAIAIGMLILGGVLFYWAGEDARQVPHISKLSTVEKQIEFTGTLVTALNLGMSRNEQLINDIIESSLYTLNHFKERLDKEPKLKVRVLMDLSYEYDAYKNDYKKGKGYRDEYEKLANKYKELYTKEEWQKLQWGLLEGRSTYYLGIKEYEKAAEEKLKIIELLPYRRYSEYVEDDVWVKSYKEAGMIYEEKLHNYGKARECYEKMAIDPRELPKEKLGWMGEQGKDYGVSLDKLLELHAQYNKRDSKMYIMDLLKDFGKYREYQQMLVDEEKQLSISNLRYYFSDIVDVWERQGVYEEYKPKRIIINREDLGNTLFRIVNNDNTVTLATLNINTFGSSIKIFDNGLLIIDKSYISKDIKDWNKGKDISLSTIKLEQKKVPVGSIDIYDDDYTEKKVFGRVRKPYFIDKIPMKY